MQEKELPSLRLCEAAKWSFVASKSIGSSYKYLYCKIAILKYDFCIKIVIGKNNEYICKKD